ncbi:Ferredoxin-6 [compost metagenome]
MAGGACACATCHVYVDIDWKEKIESATGMETDMLEFAAMTADNSRLSCQLKVTPEMEGLVIHVPSQQC